MARSEGGQWGTPRLLIPGTFTPGMWSLDGASLATVQENTVVVLRYPDGKPTVLFHVPTVAQPTRVVNWSPDGRNIYYRVCEPRRQADAAGPDGERETAVILVRQRDATRSSARADWTTDGRRFFFTIHRYEGDIWTVEIR